MVYVFATGIVFKLQTGASNAHRVAINQELFAQFVLQLVSNALMQAIVNNVSLASP